MRTDRHAKVTELFSLMLELLGSDGGQAGEPEPWWSLERAAEHCDVSPETVARWVREGALPAGRRGSIIRVRRSDLDALLGVGGAAPTPPTSPPHGEELPPEVTAKVDALLEEFAKPRGASELPAA